MHHPDFPFKRQKEIHLALFEFDKNMHHLSDEALKKAIDECFKERHTIIPLVKWHKRIVDLTQDILDFKTQKKLDEPLWHELQQSHTLEPNMKKIRHHIFQEGKKIPAFVRALEQTIEKTPQMESFIRFMKIVYATNYSVDHQKRASEIPSNQSLEHTQL